MKGRIQITVSSDMMEAVGMIVEGGEEEITLELINEKLEEKGIKAGLQQEGMEGRLCLVQSEKQATFQLLPKLRCKDG